MTLLPLPHVPRPYHLELPRNYLRRLAAINLLDPAHVSRKLPTALVASRECSDLQHAEILVASALSGRSENALWKAMAFAQPIPKVAYQDRWVCRYCTAGEHVRQIPHDRFNLCLKHGIWTGPGSDADSQFHVGLDHSLLRAERRYRAIVTAQKTNGYHTQRVWEMVRDAAYLTEGNRWSPLLDAAHSRADFQREVHDRAALLPETTAVIELLTNPAFLRAAVSPQTSQTSLRPMIRDALPFAGDRNCDILVERLLLHLKPSRNRAEALLIDHPNRKKFPTPNWPHELDLSLVDPAPLGPSVASQPPSAEVQATTMNMLFSPEGYESESLPSTRPDLLDSWDYEANDGSNPYRLAPGATYFWRCARRHQWPSTVPNRRRHGCGVCNGKQVLVGYNDLASAHPNMVATWDYESNGDLLPTQLTSGSNKQVSWICAWGHRWKTSPKERQRTGCPTCTNRQTLAGFNDLLTTHPEIAESWDYALNLKVRPDMVTAFSNQKVNWRCHLGHQWLATVAQRQRQICPICSGYKVLVGYNDFATTHPEQAATWDYAKNGTLTPEDVTRGSIKRVHWICGLGHGWETTPNNRCRSKCPTCAGRKVLPGHNDLATTHPHWASFWDQSTNGNLSPQDVSAGSGRRINWRCPEGHVWSTRLQSFRGCRRCKSR